MSKKHWKYDWDKIQKFYDQENTWRDVMREFGVSNRAVQKAVKTGRLETRNRSEAMKVRLKNHPPSKMGEKARKKLSIAQTLHNRGGKCKWYTVNGIKVQGTWERDIAIKLNELGVKWERPRKPLIYIMDGKLKRYTPDFYLPNFDSYLEVKGHWWGNDKEKMKCVIEQNANKRILIIREDEKNRILQGEQVW